MPQANGRLPPRPWAPAALLGFLAGLMILARPSHDVEDDARPGRGEVPGAQPASAPGPVVATTAAPAAPAPGSAAAGEKPAAASSADSAIVDVAKKVIQFAGVIGGGTTGLAALAFAVGFLATKSHDAMLGLPTVTISTPSYVRTGALFFSNSLQNLSAVPRPSIVQGLWVVLAAALLAALARWVGTTPRLKLEETAAYLASYLLLLGFLVLYLPVHLAALDPDNKALLIAQPAEHTQRTDLPHRFAHGIREDLTHAGREDSLRSRYALQCVVAGVVVYAAIMMHLWRRRLGGLGKDADPATSGLWTIADYVPRPLVFCLAAILVSTLPASYGVLMTSNKYPCVELKTSPVTAELEVRGFLLSDLSAEAESITILAFSGRSSYIDHFVDRKTIRSMEITDCDSILVRQVPQ
jgi:hypothetical protein